MNAEMSDEDTRKMLLFLLMHGDSFNLDAYNGALHAVGAISSDTYSKGLIVYLEPEERGEQTHRWRVSQKGIDFLNDNERK